MQDETPHDDLAVKLSNEILSNPSSFNVRTLVRVLCSLRLSTGNENVLKDLKILCRRLLKVCSLSVIVSRQQTWIINIKLMVIKGKEVKLSTCMVQTTLKRSDMDHTAFNLQRTPCLPLPRKRSPNGAYTECGGEHLIAAHYSFIHPERIKGWVGLVGWPIADGLPT